MKLVPLGHPLEGFTPTRISCRKVYEVTERRNEWTNWHGDTSVIRRWQRFKLTFPEAQESAEGSRNCGTNFHIRSVPVLVLDGKGARFIVGEAAYDQPMAGLMDDSAFDNFARLSWAEIVSALLMFALRKPWGFVLDIQSDGLDADFDKIDECFNFVSVPSGIGMSLGWKSIGRTDPINVNNFYRSVKQKKERTAACARKMTPCS